MAMQSQSLDRMERAELLRQVQMHQFAMHDLALYLDTHPTDETALEHFMQHKALCEQASVPVGAAYLAEIRAYERNVTSKR